LYRYASALTIVVVVPLSLTSFLASNIDNDWTLYRLMSAIPAGLGLLFMLLASWWGLLYRLNAVDP
jgi:hypothetical protein